MFSLKYLLLCGFVIAASLSWVVAITDEEIAKMHSSMLPAFDECSKEHNTTLEYFLDAQKNHNLTSLDPCFMACVFRKNKLLDDNGMFDVDAAMEGANAFLTKVEDLDHIEDIGKSCITVNEEEVSDGEAGCERAKLLLACFVKNADQKPS